LLPLAAGFGGILHRLAGSARIEVGWFVPMLLCSIRLISLGPGPERVFRGFKPSLLTTKKKIRLRRRKIRQAENDKKKESDVLAPVWISNGERVLFGIRSSKAYRALKGKEQSLS
jgi:hypothetical protein